MEIRSPNRTMDPGCRREILLVFITFHLVLDALALTNMHIKVPEAVRSGASVTLSCDYDLESAALYTIKWFRNEEEFYRYVPKESPPSQVFPVPNLNVDVSKSNWKDVTLTKVNRDTTGEFKCEVTADAPLFHTDHRSANLVVADVPEDNLVVRSDVHKVAPGATIKANCTTPASFPRMNVTWFLNDAEVHAGYGIFIEKSTLHLDVLESVHSSISVRATSDIFKQGKLRLRCTGALFKLYTSTEGVEIQEDAPQLALIMVARDYPNTGSSPAQELSTMGILVAVYLLSSYYTPG